VNIHGEKNSGKRGFIQSYAEKGQVYARSMVGEKQSWRIKHGFLEPDSFLLN